MKVRIEIDTKTFIRFWLVVFAFGLIILAAYAAKTALIILGTSAFLALALNKPVSRLAKWLPGKSRVGGTALAFIIVLSLLGAIVFLVIPPIVQQTSKFIDSSPAMIEDISQQWHGLGNLIDKYHMQSQIDSAAASLKRSTEGWAASFGQNVLKCVGSVLSLFASTVLVIFLTFLMLVEGPEWLRRIWSLYRDKSKMQYHKRIAGRMYNVVTGYVTGQLTVSGIGALCAGATVFLLSLIFPDVPANLALPTIAICFTLSLIPMFGATIAGIIIALLLGFNDISAGIIFAIYFMVYQQIENNLISPSIQSRQIELTPLAVLAAVTIGLYVFGVIGGIISIPIAGCIKVLIEDYVERTKEKRVESDKPLAKLVRKIKAAEEA